MNDDLTPGFEAGDSTRRFLFEQADIRGEVVQLDSVLQDILTVHQYAPGVQRLLGEFLAAATLLSTTLKFEGTLILQARSNGQVPLLMAECTSDLQVRGIARGAEHATSDDFAQLLASGNLAITIDPRKGKRYQGIVPLATDSLARSLDAYFEQSEQLQTRFWLAADGTRAAGMLLQQLPAQVVPDEQLRQAQWQHVCTLGATISADELIRLDQEELLYRLYHEDPVRLFAPKAVQFHCSCSMARSRNALSAIATSELEDILTEQGCITVDCEFCNQQYRFEREDLVGLLEAPTAPILH